MHQEESKEILKAYGNPVIKTPTTNLVFARQSQEDVNQIEKMSDEQIVSNWKSLVWLNEIYGQVSLNDMQRISLIELEMKNRLDINQEELTNWYKESKEKFDISQF